MGKLKHSVLVLGEGSTEFFCGDAAYKFASGRCSDLNLGNPSSTYQPCVNLVSSSHRTNIVYVSFTYRFRIVSASVSENDRRTIGERYENNTGLIRDRYEIDTRTTGCDS